MTMNTYNTIPSFSSSKNEYFFAFEAPQCLQFNESINELLKTYDNLQKELNLNLDSEIFIRFHLSDITNQEKIVKKILQQRNHSACISFVGQAPASGSKVAMESYHLKNDHLVSKKTVSENVLLVNHNNYQSLWTSLRPNKPGPSYQQTQQLFGNLSNILHSHDLRLENDVIRTWLYVRDVDNNYQGMVDARRELFEIVGLSKGTHYIASTGIEGCGENVSDLILLDALTVQGLKPQQITYMSAPDYLCPTYEYNVTFERATRVTYGDRSHYYISGTASIDREGNILYIGDVVKQANRTLININALLSRYNSDITDLKILIVYLRDVSDYEIIQQFLKNNLPPELPYIIVRGSVCRPLWLIEMEGIAVSNYQSKYFDPFC
ncbi:translation initiation inhibitor [Candidatus Magnetomorum sp. HK-1]|nr:translation initiation inhibitor [Candidatus Magnetomorum sp. HK-1]